MVRIWRYIKRNILSSFIKVNPLEHCKDFQCLIQEGLKYNQTSRPFAADLISFFDQVEESPYAPNMPLFHGPENGFEDVEVFIRGELRNLI